MPASRDSAHARNRKAHPGIYVQNGTRFPLEAPNGNRIPDFALKLGYGFR